MLQSRNVALSPRPAPSGAREAAASARPPDTNRGVYPLSADAQQVIENTVFDAYYASISAEPKPIIDLLQKSLREAGEFVAVEDRAPARWYQFHTMLVDHHGKRLASIHSGGSNGSPLVQSSGHLSPVVAGALRGMEEPHRPSRIDACVDRSCVEARPTGLFERYHRIARRIARKQGIALSPSGDWATKDAGRTFYLGSRRSQVLLRVYEKGLEMAKKQGIPVTDELRRLVRCEVEFKPDNPVAKRAARIITPSAVWGLSDWLQAFAQRAFALEAGRVIVCHRRESDHARALRFMGRQYHRHLAQLLDEHGGDIEAFGEHILQLAGILEIDQARPVLGEGPIVSARWGQDAPAPTCR